MKRTYLASAILLSATTMAGSAWGQAGDDPAATPTSAKELDIMMSVVDEDATPEDVVNRIELPPAPEAVVELPDVELAEPALDRAEDIAEDIIRESTSIVTDSVNDALSTGDLENLPEDITDALPEEVIDEVLDDTTDEVDELVDEVTGSDDAIDSALDDLEAVGEMDGELDSLDSALDDLESLDEVESLDELDSLDDSVTDELDESLNPSPGAEDVLDDLNNVNGL